MSTQSPQQQAAGEQAAWQSQLASQLSGVTIPELQSLIGNTGSLTSLLQSTQGGQLPSSLDASALAGARGQLNQGYDMARNASAESINYQALRAGEGRLSPNATGSAISRAATSLERDRQMALNNLNFQSSMASMQDYNQLLGLMGQGVQTSLGLAGGFSGASNAAIGGMSNQSQFGSTLGGVSAGAALGATAGSIIPGVGTVVGGVAGGVIGGIGGYLGGGG